MASPDHRERPRLHWPSIGVGALVGLLIAVAGPLLVSWFQSHEPKLVYSAPETIPFHGPEKKVATYQVLVANDGRRAVEDVICVIRVPGASIEQRLISPANLSIAYTDSVSADSIRIQVPSLNPSETLQVSTLASTTGDLPTMPEVSLRGRGVVGEQRRVRPASASLAEWVIATLFLILGVFAGMATVTRMTRGVRRDMDLLMEDAKREFADAEGKLTEMEKETKSLREAAAEMRDENLLDQRLNLAYLCRVHGLEAEADLFLRQSHRASYWSESDRLADAAAKSPDAAFREKVTAVLDAVSGYIRPGGQSHAIILFNLAKIAISAGDEDRARDMLQKSLDSSQDVTAICLRVGIDPAFKGHRWVKELLKEHPRVKELLSPAAVTASSGEG